MASSWPSSSRDSLSNREFQPGTSPGWIAPNEIAGSLLPLVGGGHQAVTGGVPVHGSLKGDDTTALGWSVWNLALSKGNSPSSSSGLGPAIAAKLPSEQLNADGNRSALDPSLYDFSSGSYVCRALAQCEPCPPQARNHPFCRPYGNRRLVACQSMLDPTGTSTGSASDSSSGAGGGMAAGSQLPPGEAEFLGWEACGKVVREEARDYLEFVMILILIALAALLLLIQRNRKLHKILGTSPGGSTGTGTAGGRRRRRARLG